MNLRFQIKQVDYNPIPEKICGEATYVDYNQVGLVIYVDDEIITQTANLDSIAFAPTVPPIITTVANGIDVTSVVKETGDVVKVGIDLLNIWDKAKVRIVATKNGYNTVDKTFIVYGYDLGNNAAVNNVAGNPIDYNYNVDFVLVDNTEPNKTYASLIGWRAPFTDCLRLYKNDSATYSNIVYNPNEVATIENPVLSCTTGDTFNQTVNLIQYNGSSCPGVLVDTCTSPDVTTSFSNLIPQFGFFVECKDGCCNTNCIVKTNDNVVKPSISYSAIADIFVDDDIVAPFDTIDMVTEIIDCEGNIVFINVTTIDTSLPLDVSNVEIPFTIPSKGDYIIRVTYENDAIKCVKTQLVEGCEQYHIEKIDCNKYKACIYRVGDIGTSEVLSVSKLNKNKEFDVIATYDVDWCSCYEVTIEEDGVYSFTFENQGDAISIIVIVDCAWKQCSLDFIKDIVCGKTCGCQTDCQCQSKAPTNLYDFNAFMALTYGYLSLLNDEYLNNYLYSHLDPSKIDELYDIDMFLTRVADYCKSCKIDNSTTTTQSSSCGCKKL